MGLAQPQHHVQPSLFCCSLVQTTPCKSTSSKHRLTQTQRHTAIARPCLRHAFPVQLPCLLAPEHRTPSTPQCTDEQVPGDNPLMFSHGAAHSRGSAWGKAGTPLPAPTKPTSTMHTQGQSHTPRWATSPGQQSCCREATSVHLQSWRPPKPSTLGCSLRRSSRCGWGASLPQEPPGLSPEHSGF